MPFENALISKDEYEAYCLSEIDRNYPLSNCSSQWTIDRSQNIHMRCVSRAVPSDMGPHDPLWLLFWKTDYVLFRIQIKEHATEQNGWVAHKALTQIELPESLKAAKSEIIRDIEAALKVYGTGGVHCKSKDFTLAFEVCL